MSIASSSELPSFTHLPPLDPPLPPLPPPPSIPPPPPPGYARSGSTDMSAGSSSLWKVSSFQYAKAGALLNTLSLDIDSSSAAPPRLDHLPFGNLHHLSSLPLFLSIAKLLCICSVIYSSRISPQPSFQCSTPRSHSISPSTKPLR